MALTPETRPPLTRDPSMNPPNTIQPQVGVYTDAMGVQRRAYMQAAAPGSPGAAGSVGGPGVTTTPGTRTLVPLDASSVTTGGTAIVALLAGHRTAGGFIQNPLGAATNLGINEIGTASGTTSAGSTTFIQPGQSYALAPSGNAVSVISSDSAHVFSGLGYQ